MKKIINQAQPEGRSLPESGHSVNFRPCVAASVVIPGVDVLVAEYRRTATLAVCAERSVQRLVHKLAFALPQANSRVSRCAFARMTPRHSGALK